MPEKIKEYIKLQGRGVKRGGFFSILGIRARLWMGKEHLLYVYNKRFEEEYKRFYYKDIQAIIIHKNNRARTWNIIFGILAVTFALWRTELLPLTGFFLLLMLINWLRGPTCVCTLQTAVSKEELPSLSRLRNAEKAVKRLRPLIERAQGRLSEEEITVKAAEATQNIISGRNTVARSAKITSQTRHYNGNFHKGLFYVLILDGILTSFGFFYNHIALTFFGTVIFSVLGILTVMALVKQKGFRIKESLKYLTWSVAGYAIAAGMACYIIAIAAIIDSGDINALQDLPAYLRVFSTISPFDNAFLWWTYIISIIYSFSTGIAGLFLLRKFRPSGIRN